MPTVSIVLWLPDLFDYFDPNMAQVHEALRLVYDDLRTYASGAV